MLRRSRPLGVLLVVSALLSALLQPAESAAQRRRRRPRRPRTTQPARPRRPQVPRQPAPVEPAPAPFTAAEPIGADERPPGMREPPPATAERPAAAPATQQAGEGAAPGAPRPVALDATAGLRLIHRGLSYHGDAMGRWRGYDLDAAPAVHAALEWYPGAHATAGPLAHLGLTGSVEYAFALSSADPQGNRHDTSAWGFSAGLRGRIPVGDGSELGLGAAYGRQVFFVGVPAMPPEDPGVPAVAYNFVRMGASARVALGERVTLLAQAGYLLVLSTGELGREFFPRQQVHGAELGVGLALALGGGLEVRAAVDGRLYLHAMNTRPDDPYVVDGATDRFLGATLGLALRR